LEKSKPDVAKELVSRMDGAVALLLTDLDPFKLAKILRQSKSKAPAKPGMIANDDIVVPAGETNLAPGPVLTELKQAKINAKIQGSKIVISNDAVVAAKGQPISDPVSKILSKLGIEPFEIGLKIIAAVSNGVTYEAGVLEVDDKVYLDQLKAAHAQAVNLAVFAEIYNDYSTPLILASAQAKALALQKVVEDKSPKKEATSAQEPAPAEQPAPQ
jgi:large subunit ribosomal protein L10